MLSDALIDSLTPHEIAAVFGHEIGHIAHRHLLYFGFFFMGSLGLLSVLVEMVAMAGPWIEPLARLTPWPPAVVSDAVEGIVLLIALGLYFWLVFGQLSRRFERQADVFGSKVVSCDLADCPPHHDRDHDLSPDPVRGKEPQSSARSGSGSSPTPSPMSPAAMGLTQTGRSWRHGSIATRIAFSKASNAVPSAKRKFQRACRRLRIALAVVLVVGDHALVRHAT